MTLFPIAKTENGLLRGVDIDGIKRFLGIPYGAPTGGANRFRPPRAPVAWAATRDAYGYGPIAPQSFTGPGNPFTNLIDWDLHPGQMSEDCLNLNVWTPGLADNGSRPVVVYLHGGGHSQGSGNHALYTGDRLARFGDVVVVTVNHRLGALGYINLADAGAPAEFSRSGNCGALDIVQALQWVRDNIRAFGGDPANVTLFGQSGGGRKISVLLAMEQARGLFHKAFLQSGSTIVQPRRSEMAELAAALLTELGTGWQGLLDADFEDIVDAQAKIGGQAGGALEFRPYVDEAVLFREPSAPDAPAASDDVPLVIGYCRHDLSWKYDNFDLDLPGLKQIVSDLVGVEHAESVVETYRREYPNLTPFLLRAVIATDHDLQYRVTRQAERKAQRGRAPAWVYRFDWPAPMLGGRFGATHGLDMALVFHNTHQPTIGGGRREAVMLADKMAAMLVALARTGSPTTAALPDWPAYTPSDRATLLIDFPELLVVRDPHRQLRTMWEDISWGPSEA
jgi:para-nitrobenzyl esterase